MNDPWVYSVRAFCESGRDVWGVGYDEATAKIEAQERAELGGEVVTSFCKANKRKQSYYNGAL